MTLDITIQNKLADARRWAEKGDAIVMEFSLALAQGYAQKVGQDIATQVRDVERLGYDR